MSDDADHKRAPADLSPKEARELFLDDRRVDSTDETIRSYANRLMRFVEWCENEGIDRLGDLSGWDISRFKTARQGEGLAPTTIKGQMVAVRQLIEYAERIEAVDEGLADKVEIPKLSKDEETSETKLSADDARPLLEFFRNSRAEYGTPEHTTLEVLWHTGARVGGIRALDLEDYNRDEEYLRFVHRPESDTPLKNKEEGERVVGLPEPVRDVLDTFVARERFDKRDEYGREPLFASRQGRASRTTLRSWTYLATHPCLHSPCPHGNRRETCSFRHRNHASKCPSSRSPHQIRTGSITWQLDRGLPIEVVAERVNARPETIRRFYDKAIELEKFEARRREYVPKLDIDKLPTHDNDTNP